MSGCIGFELIKDLTGLSYYGGIPETPVEPDSCYEFFPINFDDAKALDRDFANPINELCGTLVGLYDVDYFNSEQCAKLREWLIKRLEKPCEARLAELYLVLLDYAAKAIDLKTGVVVEL